VIALRKRSYPKAVARKRMSANVAAARIGPLTHHAPGHCVWFTQPVSPWVALAWTVREAILKGTCAFELSVANYLPPHRCSLPTDPSRIEPTWNYDALEAYK
jgi:hypothetical protein